jgi:hypothetical protein
MVERRLALVPSEIQLKAFTKRTLPKKLWKPASDFYWWWFNRGNHQLAGLISSRRRVSNQRFSALSNKHLGQRCFILGNGPSLKLTDLSLLRNEITFGLNRIYLLFPELGFTTTYFVAINTLVIEQCSDDINKLSIPKFLTWRGRKWIVDDANTLLLDTDYTPPATFSEDVRGRVFEGSTVTYVAMQLAFYMGFKEVILIGVDHSFKTEGPPNETVVSEGDGSDHFAPDYFGKGFRWQLPDLEASEFAYELARDAYDRAGRRILDATIDGNLNIFPKVEYLKLFNPCADDQL